MYCQFAINTHIANRHFKIICAKYQPNIMIVIWNAKEIRIQTGNLHHNLISVPCLHMHRQIIFGLSLHDPTHWLCNIVMTRIIRYQKEAAHLENTIISSTLYHCIYFQAKRTMHICICICDYLHFAKWIQQFSQCSLCGWSLERGLEREGDIASLYATSSSPGGQCQDKNGLLGINVRESPV